MQQPRYLPGLPGKNEDFLQRELFIAAVRAEPLSQELHSGSGQNWKVLLLSRLSEAVGFVAPLTGCSLQSKWSDVLRISGCIHWTIPGVFYFFPSCVSECVSADGFLCSDDTGCVSPLS